MRLILDIYEYNEYLDDDEEYSLKEHIRALIPELEFSDIDIQYEMDEA